VCGVVFLKMLPMNKRLLTTPTLPPGDAAGKAIEFSRRRRGSEYDFDGRYDVRKHNSVKLEQLLLGACVVHVCVCVFRTVIYLYGVCVCVQSTTCC
jgi:hypothetical protein